MSEQKEIVIPRSWRAGNMERNIVICKLYMSGDYTAEQIARRFNVDRKTVQNIARQGGVVRSAAESNAVVAPLKRRKRIRRTTL